MKSIVDEAIRVLDIEAQSILDLKERLGDAFVQAVQLILNCKGKVIVSGMGKSGQIARKLASTLSSTGTPALYLHPAESSHGDLGVISSGDLIIAISYGGETPELTALVNHVARKDLKLIAMTGKASSSLAQGASVVLDISVKKEACPLGLAPTASSTATLAMGDAIAMAVLKERGFRQEDFAEFHPGGSLGRRLLTRVRDVMHSGEALPLVELKSGMKQILSIMTSKEVRGVAGVLDSSGQLVGIITDGDIRRRLEKSANPMNDVAAEIMSQSPKTIDVSELAEKALFVMQQFSIQTLFAVDKTAKDPKSPVGLLHLQDLLRAQIR